MADFIIEPVSMAVEIGAKLGLKMWRDKAQSFDDGCVPIHDSRLAILHDDRGTCYQPCMGMRKEGMSWTGNSALVGLTLLGCSSQRVLVGTGTIEREPVTEPNAQAAAAPPVMEVGEIPSGKLRLAWSADTRSWNRIVAFSPSGDVISVGSGRLHVHARDTGRVLESAEVCYVKSRRGLAFVTQDRALLACNEGVQEVTFPGLHTRMITQLAGLPTASAASPHGVAFAMRGGAVQILDPDGSTKRDHFAVGGEVEELAFSPNGQRLAVGLRDGRVILRDIEGQTIRELNRGKRRATGLAFSRDGSLLFVNNERFGVRVVQASDGASVREHQAGPWVSAASGLRRGWFAAAGSEGLVIYPNDSQERTKLKMGKQGPSSSCEGLAVSADGTLLCAGDRQGRVVCYTTGQVAPSAYQVPTEAAEAHDKEER